MEIILIIIAILLLSNGALGGIPLLSGSGLGGPSRIGPSGGVGAQNGSLNSPGQVNASASVGLVGVQTGTQASIVPTLATAASGVVTAAVTAPASFAALGLTGAAAGAAVAGIGAVVAIGVFLFIQHEARLHGAQNENKAVDQYVPVFDSYIQKFVQAWNDGQMSAQEAAQSVQAFDTALEKAFHSFVGQPGTSWSDSAGMAGKCDKSCTVGCCIYFGDLGPVLNDISYLLGYPTGRWGQGDPRINGRTITVPKIFPSKYSSLSRPSYTITLK